MATDKVLSLNHSSEVSVIVLCLLLSRTNYAPKSIHISNYAKQSNGNVSYPKGRLQHHNIPQHLIPSSDDNETVVTMTSTNASII